MNRSARCSLCVNGCSCRWSDPIDNSLSNSFLNSAIQISLLWFLLSYGPVYDAEAPLSSSRCSDAPLSRDSGRFGSSIASNISVFSSSFSIRFGDIDSISGVAVDSSSA